MTFVCWGAVYEGTTDTEYYNVLIPRLMEELAASRQVRNVSIPTSPAHLLKRDKNESVVDQICANKDSFHLVFVHSDTGGRNQEEGLEHRACAVCDQAHQKCDWPLERCIVVAPRKEMESWALSDSSAVCAALGFTGTGAEIGLPSDPREAERLPDPKNTLANAVLEVRGRRRKYSSNEILPFIAQQQSLASLRQMPSFQRFEGDLVAALISLGCIA